MIFMKIKPLSINEAYYGRRTKTKEYRAFEKQLLLTLPSLNIPDGELFFKLECGFSNRGSDFDNPIKPFVDVLQKKYGFNDNRIYKSIIEKTIVKKGDEFILFKIEAKRL